MDESPAPARFRRWLLGEWIAFNALVTAANLFVVPRFSKFFAGIDFNPPPPTLAIIWMANHWYLVGAPFLAGVWAILRGKLDEHQNLAKVLLIVASIALPFVYLIPLMMGVPHIR